MLIRLLTYALALAASAVLATEPVMAEDSLSFSVDVMAVLSKAGCNSGACHANRNGKGGLKLSLRGDNPRHDFLTLTQEFAGRRINTIEPEKSLLLLKPTGEVAHQGGQRFKPSSAEYKILSQWIATGANWNAENNLQVTKLVVTPRDTFTEAAVVPLKVVAHFNDNTERNVTQLACYETSNLNVRVTPLGEVQRVEFGESTILVRYLNRQAAVRVAFLEPRENFTWKDLPSNNFIDRAIQAKLKRLQIEPAPLCDDATFIRRVSLDVIGTLPSAEQAQAFVKDTSPNKRNQLIDELLKRKEYSEFWALKWSDLLRNEEKVLDRKGVDLFHTWIRRSLADGKPMDEFVREMLVGRGSSYEFPAANYYRANRDTFTRAETTARLFLGLRLQCAKCHNHPFDRWTQDDYYQWAAWFPRIDYQIVSNDRGDKFDKNAFNGEQIIDVLTTGEVRDPRDDHVAEPKFLGVETPEISDNDDRSWILAQWLASRNNPLFLKAQVNWVWYHLLGRGLVEPIDDVRDTNPASHPELLNQLAQEFGKQNCDLRSIVRVILQSRTYQAAAEPNATNRTDELNYSKALIVRLPAEVLLDAQSQVIGSQPELAGYTKGTAARQVRGVNRTSSGKEKASGDRFLKLFGKPDRLLACECERTASTTLNQALFTLSDADLQRRLSDEKNRLHGWLKAGKTNDEIVTLLYWTALSRAPSGAEQTAVMAQLNSVEDRSAALQDVTWAIINSKEFMFRH
jgi:Protein of unknown function (DUF1549)/Protein of unknown function (DUF1553)